MMKKFLQYIAHRSAFALHDPRLPKESTVSWREYLVLSLADEQVRSLRQTHEKVCELYGKRVCQREWHAMVEALTKLEQRGLLAWSYDGKSNRLYLLTEAGRETLRCYNVPPYAPQTA